MKYIIMALVVLLAAMIFLLEVTKTQATDIQIHQITFEDHEGNTIYREYFAEGTKLSQIELPDAPDRMGYTFIGWSIELPHEMPGYSMVIVPSYIQSSLSIDVNL